MLFCCVTNTSVAQAKGYEFKVQQRKRNIKAPKRHRWPTHHQFVLKLCLLSIQTHTQPVTLMYQLPHVECSATMAMPTSAH